MVKCFVRACKANKDGKCTKTKEEWLNEPCPLIWLFTGHTGPVKEILKDAGNT